MTNLTDLENTVLQMMLNGDHPVLKYLRPQLELCHVEKRKFTGTGFYTELYVNLNTVVLPKLSIAFGDIAAEVSGLQYGAGGCEQRLSGNFAGGKRGKMKGVGEKRSTSFGE